MDGLDLGRARAGLVKHVAEPFLGQATRELDPDDPFAHAEHLRVVAEDGSLDREAIMCRHSAHALDLVRRDGNAETGAADQKGSVDLAGRDQLGRGDREVRVGGLVGGFEGADIDDGGDAGIGLEVGLDFVLVAHAGILGRRRTVCQRRGSSELHIRGVGAREARVGKIGRANLHRSRQRSSTWVCSSCL